MKDLKDYWKSQYNAYEQGKNIARDIGQQCAHCMKSKRRIYTQLMGNLPPHRVQLARPFINCITDFSGLIWIHYPSRGIRPQKSYLAVDESCLAVDEMVSCGQKRKLACIVQGIRESSNARGGSSTGIQGSQSECTEVCWVADEFMYIRESFCG